MGRMGRMDIESLKRAYKLDPWRWEGTFEEIYAMMNDEDICEIAKAAGKKQHMEQVNIARETAKRLAERIK